MSAESGCQLFRGRSCVFQRNTREYELLLGICKFIIEGLLLSDQAGEDTMASFLDDQSMHSLFENFVREFYRAEHPELSVSSPFIPWTVDADFSDALPQMRTDTVLSGSGRAAIIDTKFYSKTMNHHEGVETQLSANMYQIYAYVKNWSTGEKFGEIPVSGVLLYAATDETIQPDHVYRIDGHRIGVTTVDLNSDFASIQAQLDQIPVTHLAPS